MMRLSYGIRIFTDAAFPETSAKTSYTGKWSEIGGCGRTRRRLLHMTLISNSSRIRQQRPGGAISGTTERLCLESFPSEARRELLKYSLIIIASLPLFLLYPFIQRYFVKGIMIGAIKG